MAFDTPGSINKLDPRHQVHKETPRSTDITPVNHQYSTTPTAGWHYAGSSKHCKQSNISQLARYSSEEEHEGDTSLWQFEASGDGAPSSGSLQKTAARRVCHVCGVQVMPQLYCPSCGHPMCRKCGSDGMSASGPKGEDEDGVDGDEAKNVGKMCSVVGSLSLFYIFFLTGHRHSIVRLG
jgi:hypothetical protein